MNLLDDTWIDIIENVQEETKEITGFSLKQLIHFLECYFYIYYVAFNCYLFPRITLHKATIFYPKSIGILRVLRVLSFQSARKGLNQAYHRCLDSYQVVHFSYHYKNAITFLKTAKIDSPNYGQRKRKVSALAKGFFKRFPAEEDPHLEKRGILVAKYHDQRRQGNYNSAPLEPHAAPKKKRRLNN